MSLIISRVRAIAVSLPLRKPMHMAGVRITHAENLLVCIETAGGLRGWGEAASAPTMTGDFLPSMVAAVERGAAPRLEGRDACRYAALMAQIHAGMHRNTGAKAAVECALLDLVGRHYGVPVHVLLGGALRESVSPMVLLGNESPEADLGEAVRKRADGVGFFKIKVGVKSMEDEVRNTLALRRELGPDVLLCADANMGLTAAQTRAYCAGVEQAGLLFFEQPLRSDTLEEMSALARQVSIPMCADESVGSVSDIAALQRVGAIAGVNLKTIKLGGMTQVLRAGVFCQQHGLSINLAGKVAESSIAGSSILHLGAVVPNLDWGISMTNHYLAEDLVREPLASACGELRVNDRPGLGIDVDDAAVARFTLR